MTNKTGPLALFSRLFGSSLDKKRAEAIQEKSNSKNRAIGGAVTVGSNASMAALFLSCWIWPNWLSSNQYQYLSLMTLIEIIMVMMMFFLVPLLLIDLDRKLQRFIIGFLFFFFGIFVLAMALGVGEYLVIIFFAYTVFNKVLAIRRLRQSTSMPLALGIDWVGSAAILLITSVIAFGIPMPELGLASDGSIYFDKSNAVKYNMEVNFNAYEKSPQMAMAFGVVYYTLQAFAQKFKSKWADKRVNVTTDQDR